MNAQRGVERPGGEDVVQRADIFKKLERAGLNALSARAGETMWALVDDAGGHTSPREVHGKGRPRRACTDDKNIEILDHLPVSIICVIST